MMSIVVRREDGSLEHLAGGEILFANLDVIAEIADATSLPSLEDYADDREPPEDFDGDPEDARELLGPFDTWFDGSNVAPGLQELATAVRDQDEVDVADAVLELAARIEAGPRFHLDVE